jgi:membrane-bound lytic murein transglycosylase D
MRAAKERFGTDFERILAEYDGRTFGFASKNFYKEFPRGARDREGPAAYFPEGLAPLPPAALDRIVLDAPTLREPGRAPVRRSDGKARGAQSRMDQARARTDRNALPAGTRVWLPEGTVTPKRAPAPAPAATVAAETPAGGGGVHVVRKGETLFRIATAYGISLTRLLEANGLNRSTTIHPGQEIRIPR